VTPEVVPQAVAGPLNTIAGYGVAGALAAILLLVGLYAFKRLLDRVLDANDQAVKAALAKMDKLDASISSFREDVISELRELKVDFMSTSRDLVAASGRVEQVVKEVENSSGVYSTGPRRRG
jgi:hypothetical protein